MLERERVDDVKQTVGERQRLKLAVDLLARSERRIRAREVLVLAIEWDADVLDLRDGRAVERVDDGAGSLVGDPDTLWRAGRDRDLLDELRVHQIASHV